MFQGEHSAILLTFIKLPFVIKIFVLSIFEWLFYTGFTVLPKTGLEKIFWTYSSCGASGLNFSLVLTPVELVLKSGILKETKHIIQ